MTKVLVNQYSSVSKRTPQKQNGQEKFQRGTVLFPLQYYLNDTSDPSYDLPIHWHTEFELLHVQSGAYTVFIKDRNIRLEQGDLCFIPGKTLHGDAQNKGQALYESVVFDIELIRQHGYLPDSFINAIITGSIILDERIPRSNEAVSGIAQKLFESLQDSAEGYELEVSGYLLIFLGALKRQHLYIERQIIPSNKRKQAEQLESVINLIRKRYAEDITLELMADTAGLSPKYFCRIFREATEHTPVEYLNWYRINQSCTMLRETNDKLSEIAEACGFNDFSYFIKMFKRYKGMTPLKYRNFGAS